MTLIRRCCVCKSEMGRSEQPGKVDEVQYTDGYCRPDYLHVVIGAGLATAEEAQEWAAYVQKIAHEERP